MDGGAGKGDTPRPVNKTVFDENYTKIFGDRAVEDFQKCGKTVKVYSSKGTTDDPI